MAERTQRGGTRTSEGWIPHHRHPCGLMLPVRVRFCESTRQRLPSPVRDCGRLVYTLPGGGEYVPPDDLDYEQEMKTP